MARDIRLNRIHFWAANEKLPLSATAKKNSKDLSNISLSQNKIITIILNHF